MFNVGLGLIVDATDFCLLCTETGFLFIFYDDYFGGFTED